MMSLGKPPEEPEDLAHPEDSSDLLLAEILSPHAVRQAGVRGGPTVDRVILPFPSVTTR